MTLPAGLDDLTRPGAVLGERYELGALLGSGGAGAVHLAHDRLLDRDVAIKLLRPGQDAHADARLRAEARIAGALTHPGVARLLGFGEEPTAAGPMPYLVMEVIDGRTLRDVLRSGDRLSASTVLRLVGQVAEALAVVHRAGIVHRDLKPANIMIARDGRAVLLDFGIARHHSEEPLTLTGTIVGTVDYISPEQAAGSSASSASDLYALGTVAYECLTGLRPLSRDTQVSTLMAHATIPMPPLPPSHPDGLRELIAALTALDPAQRPPSADAVAQRARALLLDPTTTTGAASAAAAVRPVSRRSALLQDARRRHLVAAACAAVLALVIAGVLASHTDAPQALAADEPGAVSSTTTSAGPAPVDAHSAAPAAAVRAPARHRIARPIPKAHHVKPKNHPRHGRKGKVKAKAAVKHHGHGHR